MDSGVNGDLTFEVIHSHSNLDVFALGDITNRGDGNWTVELVSNAIIDREGVNSGTNIIKGVVSYQVNQLIYIYIYM